MYIRIPIHVHIYIHIRCYTYTYISTQTRTKMFCRNIKQNTKLPPRTAFSDNYSEKDEPPKQKV